VALQPVVESIEASSTEATPGSILDEEQFKVGVVLPYTPILAPASSRTVATPRLQARDTAIHSTPVALRL